MQQIAGNEHWELTYDKDNKTYFIYHLKSEDVLTITETDDFIEMADMMQAHIDGNLIE